MILKIHSDFTSCSSDVSTTYAGKTSLSATTIMKSMIHSTLTTSQANLTSSTPTSSWQVSTSPVQSQVQPAAPSSYPSDGILPTIQNMPPPPKLIKIPTTSPEDVPTPSRSEPQELARRASSDVDKDERRRERPVSLSSNDKAENKDVKYLQAIVDLQERIHQQLSTGDSGMVDKIPVVDPAPHRQAFHPPQYCMASPPELLLDIISQSRYVKQHECTIEKIEIPVSAKKDNRQPASLNHCRTAPKIAPSAIVPKLIHTSSETNSSSLPILSNGDLFQESNISWIRNVHSSSHQERGASSPQMIHRNTSLTVATKPEDSVSPAYRKNQSSPGMVPPLPNYCVALNPFPVMLVNSAIPLVQQIPTAMNIPMGVATTTGLPSNQLVCYVSPNGLINPLISQGTNELSDTANHPIKHGSLLRTSTQLYSEASTPSLDSLSKRRNGIATSAGRLGLTHNLASSEPPPPSKRLCLEPAGPAVRGNVSEASSRHQVADSLETSVEEPEEQVGSSSSFSEGPHSTLTSESMFL